MQARFNRLLLVCAALLGLGLGYAALCRRFGVLIPCPFHALTGLSCPGCGVSHMCLALLRLDLAAAFRYQPALLLSLPILGVLFVQFAAQYVRTGSLRGTRRQNRVICGLIVWFLLFGVVRNLPGVPFV